MRKKKEKRKKDKDLTHSSRVLTLLEAKEKD
jgi:hypothetical protein